jgi:hypothetical protein
MVDRLFDCSGPSGVIVRVFEVNEVVHVRRVNLIAMRRTTVSSEVSFASTIETGRVFSAIHLHQSSKASSSSSASLPSPSGSSSLAQIHRDWYIVHPTGYVSRVDRGVGARWSGQIALKSRLLAGCTCIIKLLE